MLASLSHNWHQGSDRDITKNLKFGRSTRGFAIRFTAPELGNQRPVISEDFKLLNLLILSPSSLFAANLKIPRFFGI